jgi:hypothetical protein
LLGSRTGSIGAQAIRAVLLGRHSFSLKGCAPNIIPEALAEGPQSSEWVGRCSVQANRKRGDDSVGACANCCG